MRLRFACLILALSAMLLVFSGCNHAEKGTKTDSAASAAERGNDASADSAAERGNDASADSAAERGNDAPADSGTVKDLLCINEWGWWEYSSNGFGSFTYYNFHEDGIVHLSVYDVYSNTRLNTVLEGVFSIKSNGTIQIDLNRDTGKIGSAFAEDVTELTFTYKLTEGRLTLVENDAFQHDRQCYQDKWIQGVWAELEKKDGGVRFLEENYPDYLSK